MVNTFVTFFSVALGGEYRWSAGSLDKSRIWKQCLEAYQILNILQQLDFVARQKGWPACPSIGCLNVVADYATCCDWVKTTRKRYLDTATRYVILNGSLEERLLKDLPVKLFKNSKWELLPDGSVKVSFTQSEVKKLTVLQTLGVKPYETQISGRSKREVYLLQRRQVALPSDTVYSLGFSQHAAVRMWAGYQDALRVYICDHLEESLRRGVKCEESIPVTRPEGPEGPAVHPWWVTSTSVVINSHRAALVRKELSRDEPAWYLKMSEFMNLPAKCYQEGYVWVCNLSLETNQALLSGVDVAGVAATINDDRETPAKLQESIRRRYGYSGPYFLDVSGRPQIQIV